MGTLRGRRLERVRERMDNIERVAGRGVGMTVERSVACGEADSHEVNIHPESEWCELCRPTKYEGPFVQLLGTRKVINTRGDVVALAPSIGEARDLADYMTTGPAREVESEEEDAGQDIPLGPPRFVPTQVEDAGPDIPLGPPPEDHGVFSVKAETTLEGIHHAVMEGAKVLEDNGKRVVAVDVTPPDGGDAIVTVVGVRL